MDKIETAKSLFKQGFNCSQALFGAYSIKLGLKQETAFKIASAFGGGIGRMGETCGAVTGAFMIIGLKYGMTDAKNKKSKMKTYEVAGKFINKFKSRNNSIICRELVGFDMSLFKTLSPDLSKIVMEQCPKLLRDSAEIIDEIL